MPYWPQTCRFGSLFMRCLCYPGSLMSKWLYWRTSWDYWLCGLQDLGTWVKPNILYYKVSLVVDRGSNITYCTCIDKSMSPHRCIFSWLGIYGQKNVPSSWQDFYKEYCQEDDWASKRKKDLKARMGTAAKDQKVSPSIIEDQHWSETVGPFNCFKTHFD